MATRKKTARKKATRTKKAGRRPTRASDALARIERELPGTLREYSKDVQKRLARLEKEIDKATTATQKQATRLLREASYWLGQLETRGDAAWQKLTGRYRRDAVDMLRRLEELVPLRRAARKKVAKKKTARKSTARKKSTGKATARKTAKRKSTTSRKTSARKSTSTKKATRKKARR